MTKTPPTTAGTGAVFPEQYEVQLADKIAKVKDLFAAHKLPEIEVYRSSAANFRMRTEFRIWHEGEDLCYVMFEQPDGAGPDFAAASGSDAAEMLEEEAPAAGEQDSTAAEATNPPAADNTQSSTEAAAEAGAAQSNGQAKGKASKKSKKRKAGTASKPGSRKKVTRVRIDEFPVASQLICSLMPLLRAELIGSEVLREKLFQVAFHTTLSKQAMITLAYHKQLTDVWQSAAEALRSKLLKALGPEQCTELHIIGRSRKQKIMLAADHVTETMEVEGRTYEYMQVANCFSQPNGGVCQQMLSWAVDVTKGSSGDLLELYCGNGNFTLPLAQNFKQVVATEVSKASVTAARHNIQVNGIDNIFLARMSSEEFVETWRVKGTRNRLAGLDWEQLSLNTLLVDPPRAGLDPDTEKLLREFDQVVYISCNPETLAKNLAAVSDTHEIKRFAVFDQFAYTPHLETGVLLKRKSKE